MLIPSDILSPSIPFKEDTGHRGLSKVFNHVEKSDAGSPLFTIELVTNARAHETEIKIQKHEAKKNAWLYRTKYDGVISGPNDFRLLLKWLKIID